MYRQSFELLLLLLLLSLLSLLSLFLILINLVSVDGNQVGCLLRRCRYGRNRQGSNASKLTLSMERDLNMNLGHSGPTLSSIFTLVYQNHGTKANVAVLCKIRDKSCRFMVSLCVCVCV